MIFWAYFPIEAHDSFLASDIMDDPHVSSSAIGRSARVSEPWKTKL